VARDIAPADKAYDADGMREFLVLQDTEAVISQNPAPPCAPPLGSVACRLRNLIGHVFHELKDWRGMATYHDKTAWNFLARGPSPSPL
jgi:putative transposase